ncbi:MULTISPECIES: ABC transporter ATP-binding protein [unclassified Mesorhizobium]|uniref:ABC transporter ATP-binding protein n=1 Tax=unclassified Mesorhizobium TaxID=325217 RepID=UPI00086C8D4E|nr:MULTISPECIES: ABC transporter ATP-binding protein [unclassified Mesorhizobium]MBN9257546.1 ABC transporter ATP-binding protein [Mesorhizobium sp.]MBN9272094.1 ABC transporter ATP-binding protein [Mesorhizobium sp.]ODT12349.1 MAG: ABC transporter [Mesorhizobium sp. SCN 65-12]OJX83060.1 MAG: ABC transporter [Mesorhizobium sp. 65-26]
MTATPSAPVIDLVDLKIEAKSNDQWSKIVNGVSLSIRPGEVLGLVGESGAGKSTVGLAALGYFRPGAKVTGGEVRLLGQNILDIPEEERRKFRGTKVAYVAQSAQAAFNPAYRLMDQIIMVAVDRGGLTREAAQKRALDLFHALQLPDPRNFGKRYPHQVSGGQLQRAMVAMAMICNPALIIFDEPTTALDVTTQVEVLISIRKVIEDYRVAAIYITHDLAVVAQVAHRVAVLRYGEVVEEAPIAQIMERPTHPYTKSLWAVHEMPVGQGDRHGKGAPLLAVTGLGAHYGDFQVLTAIDLDVGRGETVALVGESGSGKSTLGRVIVGLKEVSSGQVVYEGKPLPGTIRRRSLEMLKQIQIIYQSADTALNPRQTVRKIIGRPLTLYQGLRGARREERVLELLKLVELNETHIDRTPGQLSGGQKQRIAIARALAADPRLIVCDEITSALDKVVQAEVLRMLMRLQERLGVSYLFITHDIEVVRAIADRVVVMQDGKIVEQGGKDQVLAQPRADYTRKLLDSVPDMAVGWLDGIVAARAA